MSTQPSGRRQIDPHMRISRPIFRGLGAQIAPQRWRMDEAQIEAMDRLEDDYANLREAVQWSLTEENGCLATGVF